MGVDFSFIGYARRAMHPRIIHHTLPNPKRAGGAFLARALIGARPQHGWWGVKGLVGVCVGALDGSGWASDGGRRAYDFCFQEGLVEIEGNDNPK